MTQFAIRQAADLHSPNQPQRDSVQFLKKPGASAVRRITANDFSGGRLSIVMLIVWFASAHGSASQAARLVDDEPSATTSRDGEPPNDPAFFTTQVQPFFQKYCVCCHHDDNPKAEYRIDDLSGDFAAGEDTVRWEKAHEMISLGEMPPSTAKLQPTESQRRTISNWIGAELKQIGRGKLEDALKHPSQANRVPHDELFSGEHAGPASSPPRLWRLSPDAYSSVLSNDGSSTTFEVLSGHGFKNYASLPADEAAVNMMLQTTAIVASFMVGEKVELKRTHVHGGHKSKLENRPNHRLTTFYQNTELVEADIAAVVDAGYSAVYDRAPRDDERERFHELLRNVTKDVGHQIGIKTMLRAMMMSPEFMFRMELGLGEQLPDGRRMLSPMELAYAIGFAILDTGPDAALFQAVEEGSLKTRVDVEREVRRLLAIKEDPRNRIYQMSHNFWAFKPKKARLLRFFREYFGYTAAEDVFKDASRARFHDPMHLVRDADQLVLYAIEQDQRVLEFLLTTDKYFVSYHGSPEDYDNWKKQQLASTEKQTLERIERDHKNGVTNPVRYKSDLILAYNIEEEAWNYEPIQPFVQHVPRAGILTHPAWLVAHSGNFDNDIVRRGKWIREHLLADIVPELPIGVDAQLTTDSTLTLREKFKLKVYNDECWRCHKQMNPLGDPFEMYNDFGQYRNANHFDHEGNIVGSPNELGMLRERARRDRELGREFKQHLTTAQPVATTGVLEGTGDPELDGEVKDAIDLLQRLAKSERVRQCFIRYAFRYWMGRNENLDDSPTLIAADKAYAQSDGSFNELVVSLLTSDSFLYRK